ncbi:polypeptide N-acetylgalactosaminyltransferase 10-like [Octopus bimaculoides]|uniref:Glycosyltransferase 2-like domain-containing protein n=1 Tax=Octopus bimaculoides TaxID=37653 RepID=A0A0L8HHR2_OCTBM|nr:polypeptide N-acetylgalactosaminyltransferase 10-like [Octopus bimaculoides]
MKISTFFRWIVTIYGLFLIAFGYYCLIKQKWQLEQKHANDNRLIFRRININTSKKRTSDLDKTRYKIDWHDYQKILLDSFREGPGEQGRPVVLSAAERIKEEQLFAVNGFNGAVSDKISLYRSLRDIRHPDCKHKKYLKNLPKVSVIIPFYNEHWTTLLRTIYGVLWRSPPELIQEIILVDDFSTKDHNKEPLSDYVKENFKKVKLIRNSKREGLIRSRLQGAETAKAEVIVFLDSHVEPSVNWLPPLLEPIVFNEKTVVCPFIDVIDHTTFSQIAQDEGARGAFDWNLNYKRLPRLKGDQIDPTETFESPVMAGGLFAMNKAWFWTLGGYDPHLDIRGAEQFEISFKIWLCGGQILDAPCSRVAHIYREFIPYSSSVKAYGDYLSRNHKRVVEVWMDEYKQYAYKMKPSFKRVDAGNISQQLALRKKLRCKSFRWFLEEVAFDVVQYYPIDEGK